jgi:eukaryotic-like serine/threonine-protein kinase
MSGACVLRVIEACGSAMCDTVKSASPPVAIGRNQTMIGQSISHYKILEKLGEGGMGIVYKAQDTELDRPVALKFLPRSLTSDSAEKERFYHEARAASALNHPNVSTIHEIREFDGQLFLAMELVEGQTLKKLVSTEPLPLKKVLDIAIQVCDGLASAHEKGIVHRDIKSDNIMMTSKGQVKIMDFGLAKVKGATKLTRAGSTIGTAAYMSPEQAQGLEVDHRSDIFSLGVVLYELLTTKLPFRGEHQAALMYSLINEEPQPVARFNEKASPEIERVVGKALAKNPEERYQHVDEMLADLRRERKQLEYARAGYASMPAMPPVPPTKNRRFLRYLVPIGAVVLLGILAVIFNPFNLQLTTQQSTAAEKNSIAVMYFENVSDPQDQDKTARMLTSLLVTGLSESKSLKVLSTQRLYDILKQLGKENLTVIDRGVATEVAKKAGVSLVLTGEVLQRTPSLVLTVEVSKADGGEILVAEKVTGASDEDIFAVVDRLSANIRKSLLPDQQNENEQRNAVASMMTHSEEAFRYYVQGLENLNKLYLADAAILFAKAVAIDSTFAMAHFGLSVAAMNTPAAKTHIADAVKYANRATTRDHDMIMAFAAYVSGNTLEAVRLFEEIVRAYPDDKDAHFRLGVICRSVRKYDDAIRYFNRAIELDPAFKMGYNLLAYTYDAKGDFDKSIQAINMYIALAPDEANPYDTRGDLYSYHGKYREAIDSYRRALSAKPDFFASRSKAGFMYAMCMDFASAESCFAEGMKSRLPATRIQAVADRAFLLIHLGKYREAFANTTGLLREDRSVMLSNPDVFYARTEALLGQENRDALFSEIESYLASFPSDTVEEQWYVRAFYVNMLSEFGAIAKAEEVLAGIRVGESSGNVERRNTYLIALAHVALAKKEFSSAVEILRKVEYSRSIAKAYTLARAQLGSNEVADAVSTIENALTSGSVENIGVGGGKLHYLLGIAYERSGLKEKAIGQYETYVAILGNADSTPSTVTDAKTRIAKLKKQS